MLAFFAVAASIVVAQYGYSTSVPSTAPTTQGYGTTTISGGNYSNPGSGYGAGLGGVAVLGGLLLLMIIVTAYLTMRMSGMGAKLIVIGVFLILAGTAAWLYGGYGGGMGYVWGGVAAIILGTIVWLAGDYKAGAFMMKK